MLPNPGATLHSGHAGALPQTTPSPVSATTEAATSAKSEATGAATSRSHFPRLLPRHGGCAGAAACHGRVQCPDAALRPGSAARRGAAHLAECTDREVRARGQLFHMNGAQFTALLGCLPEAKMENLIASTNTDAYSCCCISFLLCISSSPSPRLSPSLSSAYLHHSIPVCECLHSPLPPPHSSPLPPPQVCGCCSAPLHPGLQPGCGQSAELTGGHPIPAQVWESVGKCGNEGGEGGEQIYVLPETHPETAQVCRSEKV